MLLMFLAVCEEIYVSRSKSDAVVGINYESIFSESNFLTIAKL